MSLRILVESIAQLCTSQDARTISQAIQERITFPEGWDQTQIDFHRAIWRKGRGYNLRLSAWPQLTLDEITQLTGPLLNQTRNLGLPQGTFEATLYFHWFGKEFSEEVSLGGLEEVTVYGAFQSCLPGNTPIDSRPVFHMLHSELDREGLWVSATGDYNGLLPRIADEMRPRSAVVRLSRDEATRWLKQSPGLKGLALRRFLKDNKRKIPSLSFEGNSDSGEIEVIEFPIPFTSVVACAETIGRSAFDDGSGENIVIRLNKEAESSTQALRFLQRMAILAESFQPRSAPIQPPYTIITGNVKSDASRLTELDLPARATLTGLVLKECTGRGENELVIRPTLDKTMFWIRVSLGSALLLDLQEEACRLAGIVCK